MFDNHWANEPDQRLTETDLRDLYDLAHDPHPERPEHERLTELGTFDETGEWA